MDSIDPKWLRSKMSPSPWTLDSQLELDIQNSFDYPDNDWQSWNQSSNTSVSLSSPPSSGMFNFPIQIPISPRQQSTSTDSLLYDRYEDALKPIQHDLVALYFAHVHAMFPFVDEYRFTTLYNKYKCSATLTQHIPAMLLHAIMFAGLAHVNDSQLRKVKYASVFEAQEVEFERLKALYQERATTNPCTLAQVAIIMSLWSPCNSDIQVNSYWVAVAFDHEREYRSSVIAIREADESQLCCSNVLSWCCLIRERMLAIGMRRPNRLNRRAYVPPLPTNKDFGREPWSPSHISRDSKEELCGMFRSLCTLSDIMEDMAIFHRSSRFLREWSEFTAKVSSQEVQQVFALEQRLICWQEDLNLTIFGRFAICDHPLVYILKIISNSLLAILFRPYLIRSASFDPSPLQKIKSRSQEVWINFSRLFVIGGVEGIPSCLISWIALPVAADSVAKHIHKGHQNNSKFTQFLLSLGARYRGAQFVVQLLDRGFHTFADTLSDDNDETFLELVDYALNQPACEDLYLRKKKPAPDVREVDMLDHIVEMIDVGLAEENRGLNSGSSVGDRAKIRSGL